MTATKIPVPKGLIVSKSYKTMAEKKLIMEKKKAKKKAAKGRAARVKGHSFEREIAIKFREIGYEKACRLLEYQEGKGIDLANTGIYDVQCKRSKKYVSLAAINEIPFADGRVPVLVAKADFGEILAAIPFKYFLELIKPKI